jgi:hypothetical protein
MIDDGDSGEIGGMKIGRGNPNTRRKPVPAPLCPQQIPHDQTRSRTRAAAVGSQRLGVASESALIRNSKSGLPVPDIALRLRCSIGVSDVTNINDKYYAGLCPVCANWCHIFYSHIVVLLATL